MNKTIVKSIELKSIAYSKGFAALLCFFFVACSSGNPLPTILSSKEPAIAAIVENITSHNVQIRYTQIHRDSLGQPRFRSYEYGVEEDRYFYPASTAKLPVAALALQKLRELQEKGIAVNAQTPFLIRTSCRDRIIADQDSTHPQNKLTIAHLIKKVFLVSDNDAYNYLFDFLGRDYINDQLREKGLKEIQIHHKFLFGADNVNTWEYVFSSPSGIIYEQESKTSLFDKTNERLQGVRPGNGFIKEGVLVAQPMDFRKKNRISIRTLEGILQRLIFPEVFPEKQRFALAEEDYKFLRYWMSRNTLESEYPSYTTKDGYYDSYVKFLMFGDTPGKMTPEIRVYNKVGDAYGTLTDTAYFKNTKEGLEFFLTATVYVNKNGIFNDDTYEYDTLGFPFLGALGRQVYDWEKKRKQAHRPAFKSR
ncbi:MAG: serine hydrolase [Flavobacteriaceae bacterium]